MGVLFRWPLRGCWRQPFLLVVVVSSFAAGCGGGGGGSGPPTGGGSGGGDGGGEVPETPPPPAAADAVRVLASAGQGVAWSDAEFSVFGFLPPHAVVRAQVVRPEPTGAPTLLDGSSVDVFYEPLADDSGSIDSTSVGKTDLWLQTGNRPFGVPLALGASLSGLFMPADAPTPGRQPLPWSAADGWFVADGIPILPANDAGLPDETPRLRIVAVERATGTELGHADLTVPTSTATGCVSCHGTGGVGSRMAGVSWSTEADALRQAKENVVLLHVAKHGFGGTSKPVSCALCHYTKAHETTHWGASYLETGWPAMSRAIHRAHAAATDAAGAPLFPAGGTATETCVRCHASPHASRGAMAKGGIDCVRCHGDMAAVGAISPLLPGGSVDGATDGASRRPWKDLPRCESCHVGDAVDRLAAGPGHLVAADGLRLARAYVAGDASASPIRRDGSRFAPTPGTPFGSGKGHGGVRCEGCHGSAHGEWAASGVTSFDDAVPVRLQGHAGPVIECSTCHAEGTLPLSLGGPHGMHNVGAEWVTGGAHASFYASDPAACEACHGTDLAGTALSRAAADRVFDLGGRTVTIARGTAVSCALCHASHPTTQAWVSTDHGSRYDADPAACRTCHGADLAGTASSTTAADRSYSVGGATVTLSKGTEVACAICHVPHATDAPWVARTGHGAAYGSDPARCSTCHGASGAGTSLSVTAAARSYTVSGKTYSLASGETVACATCHVPHATDAAWVAKSGHGASYVSDPASCGTCHGASGAGTGLSVTSAARSYTVNGKTYSLASGATVACASCHVPHATTSTWVASTHGPLYEANPADCTVCHGADLAGTLLSKTAASRTYTFGRTTKTFAAGTTVACSACHVPHATTSTWFSGHDNRYENDPVSCRMCHGHTLNGTSLSVVAATRTLTKDGDTFTLTAGTRIACNRCHSKP